MVICNVKFTLIVFQCIAPTHTYTQVMYIVNKSLKRLGNNVKEINLVA